MAGGKQHIPGTSIRPVFAFAIELANLRRHAYFDCSRRFDRPTSTVRSNLRLPGAGIGKKVEVGQPDRSISVDSDTV